MNKILLIAICAITFSSCSTANKITQTVDDVYYSPADPGFPVIAQQQTSSYEDDEILMGIQDPRWRNLDYDYGYTPYSYGYNYDYYYNPFYCSYPIYNTILAPQNTINTTPRMTNLGAYKNTYNNSNAAMRMDKANAIKQQKSYSDASEPTTGTGVGNFLRQAFSGSNNNYSSPYNNNNSSSNNNNVNTNSSDRNYSPSNPGSGSSSSSVSGGSSGSISRPSR